MRRPAYKLFLFAAMVALTLPLVQLAHAPPPAIGTPIWQPSNPTTSTPVTVLMNVTATRGVQNVTLYYTTDNWRSVNVTVPATYNATTSVATAKIPAQALGGHVEFYIVSFDTTGRKTVNDNSGSYYAYDVPSAFAQTIKWAVLAAIVAGIGIFAIVLLKSTRRQSPQSNRSTTNF